MQCNLQLRFIHNRMTQGWTGFGRESPNNAPHLTEDGMRDTKLQHGVYMQSLEAYGIAKY